MTNHMAVISQGKAPHTAGVCKRLYIPKTRNNGAGRSVRVVYTIRMRLFIAGQMGLYRKKMAAQFFLKMGNREAKVNLYEF
jgi:hypothetical protein